MHWAFTPFVLVLLVSTAAYGTLGFIVGSRRSAPGARPFAALLFASAIWTIFYGLEISAQDASLKELFFKFEIIGIASIPACWLLFSLEYAGVTGWIKPAGKFALIALPVVFLGLTWTNPYHHLVSSNPVFTSDIGYLGPAFWGFLIYAWSVLLAGSYFLIRSIRLASRWYSRQVFPLLFGVLIPWVGYSLRISNLVGWPNLELTALLFLISAIVLAWSVFRYWTFDLAPLARSAAIDVMHDGVLLVDEQERLVDMNGVAARVLGIFGHQAIGQKVSTILARYPQFWETYQQTEGVNTEVAIENGEATRFFDLRITPLYDRWRALSGKLLQLHEITQTKITEQELEQANTLLLATLEATADGILVVNGRGKITHFNHKFSEAWRIPEDVEKRSDDQELMAFILDQLTNPAAFYRLMNKLSVQPDAESYDVLELKDGRVFERYSRPQKVDDRRIGRVWSFHDITEQRRAEERLRFLSTHDILTGLYNRVYFEEELNRLEGSRQYPISLIMADVDGLKEINDRYGHLAGDALLRRAAEILRQACRSEDMVARIGGDEFGIVLPYSESRVADAAVKRVSSNLTILRVGDLELPISMSLGTATASNGESLRKVLRQADKAMYLAKRSKRSPANRVQEDND